MKAWEKFEYDIQEMLGLDTTIASGSKFHDPGDAVSNKNYQDDPFPMMVDCKSTINKSFSVERKTVEAWREKATLFGKRFALPIRFLHEGGEYDWVVLPMGDFSDLLERAREVREVTLTMTPEQKDSIQASSEELLSLISKLTEPDVRLRSLELLETMTNTLEEFIHDHR